jgi:imidazole glycerol-phosphate synthase subunit HisF
MLKKRLIFTLLYDDGQFMLSRNFRLQKVGNLDWLQTNYNFSHISFFIDELIVLDVTRGKKNLNEFCSTLKQLTKGCFVPITAGGGLNTIETASKLLRSGADKIVVNSALFKNNNFISQLASEYGKQCVVASMDIKASPDGEYKVWSECGSNCETGLASMWIEKVLQKSIGEIYINSMDRDGTGQGYDLKILELLPKNISKPVILAGGVGNALHLAEGINNPHVDAVSTAHLFNFIGDGLRDARNSLINSGVDLPLWNLSNLEKSLLK